MYCKRPRLHLIRTNEPLQEPAGTSVVHGSKRYEISVWSV